MRLNLGLALRGWREQNSVTQEKLAEQTGIRQSLLSKYECGSARPNLKNAFRIERATNGGIPATHWTSDAATAA